MRNEGKRTEDGVVWGSEEGEGREGGEESRGRAGALSFCEIGILRFSAELMGPDTELQSLPVSWCLLLS